jgi:hypothetical protein
MKSWTTTLLLVAVCVTTLLSAFTTVLVISSAFLPVHDWLAAAAESWKAHAIRKRWARTRRRLWRRLDAALRGDDALYQWRGAVMMPDDGDDIADDEFATDHGDSDSDEDDCHAILKDWKHGRICLISR